MSIKDLYKEAKKFNENQSILDVALSLEVVEMIEAYSEENLSDNEKEMIFEKAYNYISDIVLDGIYTEIAYLKEDISNELNINQVEDKNNEIKNNWLHN